MILIQVVGDSIFKVPELFLEIMPDGRSQIASDKATATRFKRADAKNTIQKLRNEGYTDKFKIVITK